MSSPKMNQSRHTRNTRSTCRRSPSCSISGAPDQQLPGGTTQQPCFRQSMTCCTGCMMHNLLIVCRSQHLCKRSPGRTHRGWFQPGCGDADLCHAAGGVAVGLLQRLEDGGQRVLQAGPVAGGVAHGRRAVVQDVRRQEQPGHLSPQQPWVLSVVYAHQQDTFHGNLGIKTTAPAPPISFVLISRPCTSVQPALLPCCTWTHVVMTVHFHDVP